jgi:hypothetical protein
VYCEELKELRAKAGSREAVLSGKFQSLFIWRADLNIFDFVGEGQIGRSRSSCGVA